MRKTTNREKVLYSLLLLCFVLTIVVGILIIGALPVENTPSRQLTVSGQELECDITDVKEGFFNLQISIYNAEYDVTKTFRLTGDDAEEYKDVQVGSSINCYMYLWSYGSEVIDRAILLDRIF